MVAVPKKEGGVPPIARFPEEWAADAARLGGRAFHGKQIFRWIHVRGVTDAEKMTDLPAPLRAKLVEAVERRLPADHVLSAEALFTVARK